MVLLEGCEFRWSGGVHVDIVDSIRVSFVMRGFISILSRVVADRGTLDSGEVETGLDVSKSLNGVGVKDLAKACIAAREEIASAVFGVLIAGEGNAGESKKRSDIFLPLLVSHNNGLRSEDVGA